MHTNTDAGVRRTFSLSTTRHSVGRAAGRISTLPARVFAASVMMAVLLAASLQLLASQGNGPLAFEVASVKPSPDPRAVPVMRVDWGTPQPGGRWVASFAALENIIRRVYPGHLFPGQIVGGPSWVRTDWWDIQARTDPSRSNDEKRAMARQLLAERFRLAVHVETREMAGYALVRARPDDPLGPGLRTPAVDCDAYRAAQQKGEPLPPTPPQRDQDRLPCVAIKIFSLLSPGGSRITAGGTPVSGITTLIANVVNQPVIDATGLKEPFDIELEFSESPLSAAPSADLTRRNEGPSIFQAVQSQLGLKLESRRVSVEVLVIDHVERPSPD